MMATLSQPSPQPRAAGAPAPADDLSTLAWVQTELRRTLEAANKSLRRYKREADAIGDSDLDSADPAPLAAARQQLHQAVGALDMLCQPALAQVVRASEVAVQRIIARPALLDAKALELIERNAFALLDYLARQLAGKPVSPVMLFPQYRAVQKLAGADRVHPADLSPQAWQWRELPADRSAHARSADDSARAEMESLLLALMRQPDGATLAHMSDFCADLAAGAVETGPSGSRLPTFWQLASAMFEAQAGGLLKGDLYVKRIASRLLAQLRMGVRGQHELSDRLAQDLLFFCQHAAAPTAEHPAPRLAAVRAAWPAQAAADAAALVDYETASLGRFDPSLLMLARKRLASAKDVWSAVAAGELHRLGTLGEAFALVDESVSRTFPDGSVLGAALCEAANQTAATEAEPVPALAMEVATALLYLDACLEDGDFDHPELPARVARLAQRILKVAAGADPQPLEAWMEELYRRVSDRQTMGSVVQELRASLSEVEKHIDQFFRQPDSRQGLVPVPQQLSAMRGVLSVLGMSQASQAVLHMRDDVDALIRTEPGLGGGLNDSEVERLADNLGALSFLIDMLSVQPQLAKSLFTFDATTGKLSAVMGHAAHAAAAQKLISTPAADSDAARDGVSAVSTDAAQPPVPADEQVATQSLAERVQELAQSLVQPSQSADSNGQDAAALTYSPDDAELVQQLEALSQRAVAADEPELARTLASAKLALASAGDATTRLALRRDLAQGLLGLQVATEPPAEASKLAPMPLPRANAVADQVGDSGLEDDLEMREIFIEEAREVLTDARAAMQRLATEDHDAAAEMTQLRRAFHTLKGSGRMVGLHAFGEAAWACEQLFNARLADPGVAMDAPLQSFTDQALSYLGEWTEAIASGQAASYSPAVLADAAQALRNGEMNADGEAQPASSAKPSAHPAHPADPADAHDVAEALDAADEALPPEPVSEDVADVAVAVEVTDELIDSAEPTEPTEPTESEPAVHDADAAPTSDFPTLPVDAEVLPFELTFDEPEASTDSAAVQSRASEEEEPQEEPASEDDAVVEADGPPALANDLASRIPDLPSAADLDLGAASKPAEDDLHFEFDLQQLGEPIDATPLLMTTELSGSMPLDSERMPLAGTLEIPAEGLPPTDSVQGLVLDLAELDVPPDVDDEPLDTSQPLLPSDPPNPPAAERAAEPADSPSDAPAPQGEAEAEAEASLLPVQDLSTASEALARAQAPAEDEPVKVIGPLRIGIPLFNIFLNEADEQSRRLNTELAEWVLESEECPIADSTIALAHSLAGNSATVGYTDLSALGRALEHALMRSRACGRGREGEGELFIDSADEIRRLLHQFAAGFLRPVSAELMERLADHERWPEPLAPLPPEAGDTRADAAGLDTEMPALPSAEAQEPEPEPEPVPVPEPEPEPEPVPEPEAEVEAVVEAVAEPTPEPKPEPELVDHIDPELFPIFEEEADELLPQLQGKLRDWAERPQDMDLPSACMRTLHTFKGGARLAGAMRLGEMAHQLEAAIESLIATPAVSKQQVEPLLAQADAMSVAFAAMGEPELAADAAPAADPAPVTAAPEIAAEAEPVVPDSAPAALELAAEQQAEQQADPQPDGAAQAKAAAPSEPGSEPERAADPSTPTVAAHAKPALQQGVDWERFQRPLPVAVSLPAPAERASNTAGTGAVRVRAGLLDRLVNQAGEVSITRARIDADVRTLQGSLHELTESLERMRRQLRDIELQAETQISSRMEAAKAQSQAFDPLEMDRFTRFQELTRFMAESVNDVATVQRSLQRTLQSTEDELAAQARLTRELQEDLLRTRMVEFESMADRLYRTVRQAAKESGKQARLEIVGGAIEVDRGVLERMTGPFEHLLRNSVAHGVEVAEQRRTAGKAVEGQVTIQVTQAGNEVAIEFSDDGAGLDLVRIRERAVERGLMAADQPVTDEELAQFIFASGFSTATTVTELAGRGIGMDVVRSEVNAMGGRIEINSQAGQGTRLRLLLPLTTAVTQVVMLRCGVMSVAVPSTLVEVVRRVSASEIDGAYESGNFEFADESVPFFWLPALLNDAAAGESRSRSQSVVIVRSTSQRVALHVDEVVGNQEVVVKNVGPQLARLPGLAGVTLLPSGVVSLIYNPVGLASVYGDAARLQMRQQGPGAGEIGTGESGALAQPHRVPMVMVVDDSLTVRRVTQRLLVREGYRVVLAKDGLEALEKLAEERPAVLLSDIEMPRMDGFDLLRNVRADARLAGLPVVMITSRIAQKHRDYAAELGVDHYLGKPYSEELLLSLVARYCGAEPDAAARAPASALN